jgi:hypothetical protein
LKEFICDTLGYKPVLPRELFQEHRWLLDEGALSEWLIEYLNDHLSDHDAVNALVEGAFECPTADSRKALVNQCLKWLKDYPPVGAIRAQINTDHKTVVLTNTTADSSVLLSLKTELADAKRDLSKKTFELDCMTRDYNNLKKEVGVLSASFRALYEQLTK